jgi:hypothetical protein
MRRCHTELRGTYQFQKRRIHQPLLRRKSIIRAIMTAACPLPPASTASLASMQVKSRKDDGLQIRNGVCSASSSDRWPEFFTQARLYKIISRENHDAGLPLGFLQAASRGMLADRIAASSKTTRFAPRIMRRIVAVLCCAVLCCAVSC